MYNPEIAKAMIDQLKRENESLKLSVQYAKRKMTVESVQNLIPLYTGLPNISIFNSLLETCESRGLSYWSGWEPHAILKKEQLLLTLMKLRLNLPHADLAYRFDISSAQVSNIVITWIYMLEHVLGDKGTMRTIPSTYKNQQTLPTCFSDFPNTRIILDCTEIKMQIPSKLNEQNQTWSAYKHSNTLKGLVGCSPNGTVTCVSDLYGGCASDKAITADLGIMDKMVSGNTVMVDKGFKIHDLAPHGVGINIPPFLMTPQFTEKECIKTR